MHVVDTNVVWATAYDGVTTTNLIQEFTRTTNGGTNWTSGIISGYTDYGLSMICAVDTQTAWIPAYNSTSGGGLILKTIDGGASWTHQATATFTGPDGFPNVVYFWNADTGFCMGDPNDGYFELYTTTNGGTNWNRVSSSNIPANISGEWGVTGYYSVVGSTIWFSTNQSRIFKSSDYGNTWSVFTTPVSSGDQFIIRYRNLDNAIIRMNTTPYTAYKTIDGGANWTQMSFFGNWYTNDYCYVPGTSDTWVSVGADATTPFMGISYSTDGGDNWINFANMDTTQHLAVAFANNKTGWSGAFNNYNDDGMFKYYGSLFALDTCASYSADFSQSADTVDIAYSAQVDFTDMSLSNPDAWHWVFGDGSYATTQNASHTYASAGTYQVSLLSSHGVCTDTAFGTVVVVNTSSINDLQSSVLVYPNPATDEFKIEGLLAGTYLLEIISMDGQLIKSEQIENNARVKLNDIQNGVYMLRIRNDEFIINRSLLIER